MRNLTVRVPNELYTAARVYAARYNTSISTIVADFLCTLRHISLSMEGITPGAAIDIHRDLLAEGKMGRVNLEPFTARETCNWVRQFLRETEQASKNQPG